MPKASSSVKWFVYVPHELAIAIELILLDPVRHKPRYAARTQLIVSLLRQWLSDQEGQSDARHNHRDRQ